MRVITQQLVLVLQVLGRAQKTRSSAGFNARMERKNQQKENELWVS
jgi:hypothetical protein